MKHAIAFLIAIVLLVFAGVVLWSNRTALTMVHLSFVSGAVLIAVAIAVPADFKNACETIAPYVPMIRGGPPPGGAK
jgi:uncharacterized iron-regulated membrane protein